MGKDKLGSAYFEVEARVKKAEQDLEDFKRKATETASSADTSADKVGQSFDQAGTKVQTGMKKAERGVDDFADELQRLQREVREARAELDKLGAKAKQTGQEATGLNGALAKASGGAEMLQSRMGKLFIPVAVVAAVKGLIDSLKAANDEAVNLRRTFDDMADNAERSAARAISANDVTDAVLAQQDILKEAQQQADQINRQMYDSIAETSSIYSKIKGGIAGIIFGEDNSAEAKIRAANDATERIFEASLMRIQASKLASDRKIETEAQVSIDALEERRMSAIEREVQAEQEAIQRLREMREQADSDATRNKIDEAINATQIESAYRQQAIHDEAALAKRLSEDRIVAEIEAVEARAKAAERSLLSAADRAKARQADELAEVREQIADVKKDGIDTSVGEDRMLAALERIERAMLEQSRQMVMNHNLASAENRQHFTSLERRVKTGTAEGFRTALERSGMLRISQTLPAMRENLDRLADNIGRY